MLVVGGPRLQCAYDVVYIRKEGINRDNSRLGVFEMTAIRGTRSSSLLFPSLLILGARSERQTPQQRNFTRAPDILCTCEKSQPTANRVTPLRPHYIGIRKCGYGGSACDQLSVPRAEIRKIPIKPSAIARGEGRVSTWPNLISLFGTDRK